MFAAVVLPALLGALALALSLAHVQTLTQGCQLPSEWRPQSEGCRAELAEVMVYAKVLALHLAEEAGLLYSAEVELLCDQAWGSMLEVPAGSRLNISGLGYLSCHSHTVVQDYSYFFFLRMDENYNILPHGVNFQDAIFPDTADNRRTFSSLFQFSNCSRDNQPFHTFSPDWDTLEDHRLLCSSVQAALFEEEERGRKAQERLAAAERRNKQLKERLGKVKRSLSKARKAAGRAGQEVQELLLRLKAAERRAGHHLNTIRQEGAGRYAGTPMRRGVRL
ncbi:coiled-coil domain-containing protein 3-like [Nerophis ophidion]|uniref:coiled-coil domain-containing protein 3-like n=1 Tax=Nerophis ophidion TaxID=159077 RepID=UPI002AE08E02|nr:coiled-coil domain-containing protein 3-like [Nerophis ophidion]